MVGRTAELTLTRTSNDCPVLLASNCTPLVSPRSTSPSAGAKFAATFTASVGSALAAITPFAHVAVAVIVTVFQWLDPNYRDAT